MHIFICTDCMHRTNVFHFIGKVLVLWHYDSLIVLHHLPIVSNPQHIVCEFLSLITGQLSNCQYGRIK